MKEFLKRCFFTVANNSFASNILRTWAVGPKVIFYHGVEKDIKNSFVQSLHMPLKNFEEHILFLKKEYEIISIDELKDSFAAHQKFNKKHIILTFDDGYKNNLEIVSPLLKSLDVPFSVFISTHHISSGERFPTFLLRAFLTETKTSSIKLNSICKTFSIDSEEKILVANKEISYLLKSSPQEKVKAIVQDIKNQFSEDRWSEIYKKYSSDEPMNWDNILELKKSGVIIGSHCHDHFISNANQKLIDINHQLIHSQNLISNNFSSCDYLCFPNGLPEDISYDAYSKSKGIYKLSFTTIPGEVTNNSDKNYLPRIAATANLDHFKYRVNGGFMNNRSYRKEYKNFLTNIEI